MASDARTTAAPAATQPEALRLVFVEAMEWGKYFWAPNINLPEETLRVVSEGFADKAAATMAAAPAAQESEPAGQAQLRAARAEGYASGVASAVPNKVTADMRRVFREAYREGGFWADRLDYALERMLAVAPRPQADAGAPPLTPDEARWAARSADRMRGPSDVTSGTEYAMAGAMALAQKLAAAPQAPAAATAPSEGEKNHG